MDSKKIIIKHCSGFDSRDRELGCSKRRIEIAINDNFYRPVNCLHLAGEKKDYCSAIGKERRPEWGYCPFVRAV